MDKNGKKTADRKPVIGITLGDLNGVGPEVVIKSLQDPRLLNFLTPVIYGATRVLNFYKKHFELNEFNYSQVKDDVFIMKKVNVVNCWEEHVEITPGQLSPQTGIYAFKSLEKATQDALSGKIDAIVTAPINKKNMQSNNFNFPGQTEYLAGKSGENDCIMMMVSENLRIGLLTTHMALRDVPAQITPEKLSSKIRILINSLKKDFSCGKPKVAVLALNPHAGDDGLFGNEEKEILKPVLEEFRNQGHLVYGPYPADGFFGSGQYKTVDGTLAMYHDQGLTPFKTLSFETGVNFTGGLKIIRTSPDHGTAYNIAGKNAANESSMRAAIFMAKEIFYNRNPQFAENMT
ncbi:MAG TPA: 4-hydroxythreonine-4-phosphate dehydrogenase PdxA [Cyclobacteriaceae bacterium]|nr:4-hydroxythreonine-4-phosphate dehydrogenase PdxA [Cyclobacteriaceae bacterium]